MKYKEIIINTPKNYLTTSQTLITFATPDLTSIILPSFITDCGRRDKNWSTDCCLCPTKIKKPMRVFIDTITDVEAGNVDVLLK